MGDSHLSEHVGWPADQSQDKRAGACSSLLRPRVDSFDLALAFRLLGNN